MKKSKGNKGKWNETEVAMLCGYLNEGLSAEDIAERFVDIRTLAQIKTKIKSKAIQERNIDSDINEIVTDEQLEVVKDVLVQRTAEQKAKNSRYLIYVILGLTIVSAILWKWS